MSENRLIHEVLADLHDVAANFDKGWRAEPPTMAALIRRIEREVRWAVAKACADERTANARLARNYSKEPGDVADNIARSLEIPF